jgi:uncharacterized membrane protein YsdA (DUF1294 family)/cold shock CspA family protein
MRYQGKITSWKDEQGFGFITPNGGGAQIFVHISAFSNGRRRPAQNDIVTYELGVDKKRRTNAMKVAFVHMRTMQAPYSGKNSASIVFTTLFIVSICGFVFVGKLSLAVLVFYLVASVAAFIAYACDKSAAKNQQWRIPESTLHILSLLCGWPGALVAQKLLRHKSKKLPFRIIFWATVTLNCGALGWFLSSPGSSAF